MSSEYFGVVTSEESVSIQQDLILYKLKANSDDQNLNNIYAGKHFRSSFSQDMNKFMLEFTPVVLDKERESQFLVYNTTNNQIVAYKINEFNIKMLTSVYKDLKDSYTIKISNEQQSVSFKLNSIFKDSSKTSTGSDSNNNSSKNKGFMGILKDMNTWQLGLIGFSILFFIVSILIVMFYRWKRYRFIQRRKDMNHLFVYQLEDYQVNNKDFGIGDVE